MSEHTNKRSRQRSHNQTFQSLPTTRLVLPWLTLQIRPPPKALLRQCQRAEKCCQTLMPRLSWMPRTAAKWSKREDRCSKGDVMEFWKVRVSVKCARIHLWCSSICLSSRCNVGDVPLKLFFLSSSIPCFLCEVEWTLVALNIGIHASSAP